VGQAKRRGTREQRIAQAVERQKIEDGARAERLRLEEAERQERLAALPPEERKRMILGSGGKSHALLMAAAAGLLAMPKVK
jgi:hypothetical protein